MTSLTQALQRLRSAPAAIQPTMTRQLYRNAVLYLLQHDLFYGQVLSRLTVRLTGASAPLGLAPTSRDWQLFLSPAALAQTDWAGPQLLAMLRHTVLHLLWQHPQRYATAMQTPTQAGLVRWATDAAVNSYLTDLPSSAVTPAKLANAMEESVVPRQDSAVYLRQLRRWQAQQRATKRSLATGGPTSASVAVTQDGHDGWQRASDQNAAIREQWRAQLFRTLETTLTAKQRGTLPGQIQAALAPLPAQRPLDWRSLLKRGLGQVPVGRQAAYGRFNRRQPVRMDLPGEIVQTWRRVAVFVDESGSMGNQEISYLLGQITALLAVYPAQVTVYPFDTVVDSAASFSLERRPQKLSRTGGGGTRFQAVFEVLPRLLAGQVNPIVVILTDGYGEESVQMTMPVTVIWLLTSPVNQFSVRRAPGTVVSLMDDPQWRALKEAKS